VIPDLRDLLPGSGLGIRVAIVDSGLNPRHSHVGPVAAGVHVVSLGPGRIAHEPDWQDRLGHGSAVAGAVRAVAPDVDLLAVRIFSERPAATCDQLVGAIRWAIQQEARIVNLSLCTPDPAHARRLADVCDLAAARGVLIVAAGREVPATLPGPIGVIATDDVPEFGLAPAPEPLDFAAHGHPRPLPGKRPNFRGHSFAAARVSGMIARLLSAASAPADAATVRGALREAIRSAESRGASTR